MAEYIPPCVVGECDMIGPLASEPSRNLCKILGNIIIEAGGAGLMEVTVCPMKALQRLGPEQDHPLMAELRSKLGIVGYWEGDLE